MMLKPAQYTALLAAALLFVAGCGVVAQQPSLAPAVSFDQKWVYAMATVTALPKAAARALERKAITRADAKHVLALTDRARAILERADELHKVDLKTAEGQLKLADGVLASLREFMAGAGVELGAKAKEGTK